MKRRDEEEAAELAEAIKALRIAQPKLKDRAIAKTFGVSRSLVSLYRRGRVKAANSEVPPWWAKTLRQLACALIDGDLNKVVLLTAILNDMALQHLEVAK